jgi:hypothetical protein
MQLHDWERFDRWSVGACLRALGAALLACVATDAALGVRRVEAGELFPWRHLPGIPLYGTTGLVIEWALTGLGGLALLAGVQRALAVRIGLLGTLLALTQRFSNHRALLLIVLVFVAIAPPNLEAPSFAAEARPNLALVRAQLILVYASSAIGKIAHGFWTGAALASLFGWGTWARVAAPAVIVAEIAAPILLLLRPRAGLALVVALHTTMAILLPSVLPFSLTMIAMALLFVERRSKVVSDAAPMRVGSPRGASDDHRLSDGDHH